MARYEAEMAVQELRVPDEKVVRVGCTSDLPRGTSPGQVDPEGVWSGGPSHMLRAGKGSTDVVESVWPTNMAGRPRGGLPTILCHRIIVAK
jgi:hypothetical protein